MRSGEPIRQILAETTANEYDLAIIGARRKGESGLYWRPEKTYEVIKAVPPPVLVAIGACDTGPAHPRLHRRKEIHRRRRRNWPGEIAQCVGGTITLLHVMAEPPAIYADLVRLEEDVERLLASDSELGRNLRGQKEELEKMGLTVEVRIRHGLALDQIFSEVRAGKHDLIVTGTSQARGTFRHYIMGDLTRGILNRADCPVLVARAGKIVDHEDAEGGFFHRLLHGFGAEKSA